ACPTERPPASSSAPWCNERAPGAQARASKLCTEPSAGRSPADLLALGEKARSTATSLLTLKAPCAPVTDKPPVPRKGAYTPRPTQVARLGGRCARCPCPPGRGGAHPWVSGCARAGYRGRLHRLVEC